jgi:type VI secretion system Hcp family effector
MALNTYLTLTLDGVAVHGSVTQKGRENSIEVNSLEWAFDSDGNVGEVKFVGDIDKATPVIATGLKQNQVAVAFFKFWQASISGSETQYFTLHGTAGKVTSIDLWMPNNQDAALLKYNNAVQYTMKFGSMEILWTDGGISETIP